MTEDCTGGRKNMNILSPEAPGDRTKTNRRVSWRQISARCVSRGESTVQNRHSSVLISLEPTALWGGFIALFYSSGNDGSWKQELFSQGHRVSKRYKLVLNPVFSTPESLHF